MAYNGKDIQEQLNKHGYNLDVDGIVGPKTTAAIKDFQTKNGLQVDGIVGANTWGALTKPQNTTPTATTPAPSQLQAPTFNYTKSDLTSQLWDKYYQLEKPGEHKGTFEKTLLDTINQINNREKFSYDLNGDALYQQYKDKYTTQGKLAMMDTMGQAAAMTGGYGNSYAQSVGQQAYQGYLQQLNDKVPELYQLALDQYNREGQDLYDKAGLLYQMDNREYGRNQDEWDRYYKDRSDLFEEAKYMDETEFNRALQAFNIEYGSYRDDVADSQWQKTFDEDIRQFNASQASKQSASTKDTDKYKSIDVGSTAYNAILAEIEEADTYEKLLETTKRYIALGYDPDEINALTAGKVDKLNPKKPSGSSDGGGRSLRGQIGIEHMLR